MAAFHYCKLCGKCSNYKEYSPEDIKNLISQTRLQTLEEVALPDNPYPEPLGNPELGYHDPDGEKRKGFGECYQLVRQSINKLKDQQPSVPISTHEISESHEMERIANGESYTGEKS